MLLDRVSPSEVIEQKHIKGGEACCGSMICAPSAFMQVVPGNDRNDLRTRNSQRG